jgi:hypothetical protein
MVKLAGRWFLAQPEASITSSSGPPDLRSTFAALQGTVKSRLHRTLRKFEAGLAPYP